MAHKITITNIENIPWAKRLIITYYLHIEAFNPSIASWEYLLDHCAYRNVCDTEWILMSPNLQHPLHSTVIKYAGEYAFVWDYGGVFGLDPANFDAQHSYIVQLSLADHSCNIVDPCQFSSYVTQFGEEPIGLVNTLGDPSNMLNNCGEGYTLRADTNGCLFCELIATLPNPPIDDGISNNPVPEPDPTPPPDFPQDIPITVDETIGTPPDVVIVEPPIISVPGDPGFDVPEVANITPGPPAPPGNTDLNFTMPPVINSSPMPNNYSYANGPKGTSTDQGSYGPGTDIGSSIRGHLFGGRSPTLDQPSDTNALVSQDVREMISKDNAYINRRFTADQLNLNPHLITSPNKNDININSSAIISGPEQTSKVTDAIKVYTNDAYLKSSNSIDKQGTNQPSDPNQKLVTDTPTLATKNVNLSSDVGLKQAGKNSISKVSVTNDLLKSSGTRDLGFSAKHIAANLNYSKSDPDFESNFNFDVISETTIRLGDGILFDLYLGSKTFSSYTYGVSVYLKTAVGMVNIVTTLPKLRRGPIRVSKKFSIRPTVGTNYLIATVYDTNLNVVTFKTIPIDVLDASTKIGGIFNTNTSTQSVSPIDQLINPQETLDTYIGAPSGSVDLLVNVVPGTSSTITLGILVKTFTPNVEHSILIIDKTGEVSHKSTGKLDIIGIDPDGEYSAAMYLEVPRAGTSDQLTLRISNIADQSTKVKIMLGPDLVFNPLVISPVGDFNFASYSFTISSSPYPETDLYFFVAKGENISPSETDTVSELETSSSGTLSTSMAITQRGWIGIAYKYPLNIPISNKVIKYIRVGQTYND